MKPLVAFRICIIPIFFSLLPSSIFAEGGGILYGQNHAFMIQAPEGWTLDNSSGIRQGLHAVFYPSGSSWEESDVVMYVNTACKCPPHETLERLLEYDTNKFLTSFPTIKIEKAAPIKLENDSLAQVQTFTGDHWGNYESIAYIEAETIFVFIVLSSRNQKDYIQSLQPFHDLVTSYSFITSDVRIMQ